jgi:hypothetical protein
VTTYFAWMLLAGNGQPTAVCGARDAIRFLNEWGIWHGDEEEELPGDGPLPPDLQAHADGVLPEVIERPEDPEPWSWSGAAATIGINYQIVAGGPTKPTPVWATSCSSPSVRLRSTRERPRRKSLSSSSNSWLTTSS